MAETTSRTLDLLSLLQSHRHWSARELSERLGVSGRTLRRDVERLRDLGYGIEATRGAIGGYRLEAGTGLPPLLLSDDEGVAIAIGLRSQATAGLRGAEHTTLSALAKIEQVLPSGLRQRVAALQSHASTSPGQGPPVAAELLGLLALCCRDSERIRFDYTDAGGRTSARSTEPHRLVPLARRWYLLAWDRDRDAWRTFRVDRITKPFQTRVHFAPRTLNEQESERLVREAVRFRSTTVTAMLHFDAPIHDVARELGWWARNASSNADGTTTLPVEAESVEALVAGFAWISPRLSYTVEGPPELRAHLRAQADSFAAALDDGS
ncbi:helix-turn-helix transcriptional regulator [Paramicrobacterium agarici]|uniref:helix-turn-helix transcriptional regulator n=1 Tax=Paramicrobacterium agarici TaxID=630514 RepID=UPI00114F6D85|nr:YafY family protein [Microbacterium agarici]TQO22457.1 putative DNA-binding transcriptional regulator YafY [Microbacterium agarici]